MDLKDGASCTCTCSLIPTALSMRFQINLMCLCLCGSCTGFDQLCWHNFRIIGTDFSGISTEHNNSRIIGLSLHIWRCGLGVIEVWLNLYHMIWQTVQTYGPMHARKCAYFSHWPPCPTNFYLFSQILFLIGKNHLWETKYKPLSWFSTIKKMFFYHGYFVSIMGKQLQIRIIYASMLE